MTRAEWYRNVFTYETGGGTETQSRKEMTWIWTLCLLTARMVKPPPGGPTPSGESQTPKSRTLQSLPSHLSSTKSCHNHQVDLRFLWQLGRLRWPSILEMSPHTHPPPAIPLKAKHLSSLGHHMRKHSN